MTDFTISLDDLQTKAFEIARQDYNRGQAKDATLNDIGAYIQMYITSAALNFIQRFDLDTGVLDLKIAELQDKKAAAIAVKPELPK